MQQLTETKLLECLAQINTDANKTRTQAITLEDKIYAKGKQDAINHVLTTFFERDK